MTTATLPNTLRSINPETEALLHTYPEHSDAEVAVKLEAAEAAYRKILTATFGSNRAHRAKTVMRMAELLESRVDEYAQFLTLEMGKPIGHARAEVLKCAAGCRYYADHADQLLVQGRVPFDAGMKAEIHPEPLGVILAIMPWNFPLWQVFRCAAPILLSGNSMLLKHASNVPGSALLIEKLIQTALSETGEDPAAFSSLLISSPRVEAIIEDRRIRGVTLTGSEAAGRKVAAAAGKNLKKTVLELGGSDPFIVFDSADLEKAVETAVKSRLLTNGQSCIAAKRFIIHDSLYEKFRDGFVARFKKLKVGSPLDPSVELGPLATAQIREDLHALVADAKEKGATLTLGGEIPRGHGYFYPPTVVENIPTAAKLYSEEAFGPVASLYRFKSTEEALAIANATRFGLGASIWTKNAREIEVCERRVESGQLFVNTLVASDPRIPFGGSKDSGYGRELGSYGAWEWVNVKTVVKVNPVP